jgi:hypothetical protein
VNVILQLILVVEGLDVFVIAKIKLMDEDVVLDGLPRRVFRRSVGSSRLRERRRRRSIHLIVIEVVFELVDR